jgi:hypothetical protein
MRLDAFSLRTKRFTPPPTGLTKKTAFLLCDDPYNKQQQNPARELML